jgi:hypothetical protein
MMNPVRRFEIQSGLVFPLNPLGDKFCLKKKMIGLVILFVVSFDWIANDKDNLSSS